MDDFRKELRTITNQKEWTEAEKFEAIDELHEKIMAVKLFAIPVVTQRSELLIDFAQSMEAYAIHTSEIGLKEGVAKYLKSINCG